MPLINRSHLKALLKKNWIYWKRTPYISTLEVVAPILLMSVLLIVRVIIAPVMVPEQSFTEPFYSATD
jgi:hypothetical protein